jgi:trehalose 6-phosphate synthase
MSRPSRIIVLANRPPFSGKIDGQGRPVLSPGGLVSALAPLMGTGQAAWIAARTESQGGDDTVNVAAGGSRCRVRFVGVPDREYGGYYQGFANQALWPLFHSFLSLAEFSEASFDDYVRVNERFARAALDEADPDDLVWVHDYHLMLVPRLLRQADPRLRVGFFLHIPFPPAEIFRALPFRQELVAGVLGADLVGFHTTLYAANFVQAVERLHQTSARASRDDEPCTGIHVGHRCVEVGAFPIGIDAAEFEREARSPETEGKVTKLRSALGADDGRSAIALGVDRLDYTKGILDRLLAVERFLHANPQWHRRFVFVQVAVPSRTRVEEYRRMKAEIEQCVGRINGALGEPGWTPIHYLYCSLDRRDLVAYYRAADLAIVTPRCDGMNLVAKEYVATRVDDSGVLILSEFTGAASCLHGALHVNPYDLGGVSVAIANALGLRRGDRMRRMASMRQEVHRHDARWWWATFLSSLERAGAHRRPQPLTWPDAHLEPA